MTQDGRAEWLNHTTLQASIPRSRSSPRRARLSDSVCGHHLIGKPEDDFPGSDTQRLVKIVCIAHVHASASAEKRAGTGGGCEGAGLFYRPPWLSIDLSVNGRSDTSNGLPFRVRHLYQALYPDSLPAPVPRGSGTAQLFNVTTRAPSHPVRQRKGTL